MKSLHVVITANYSPWSSYVGGGQRSAHCLAEALATIGHRVTVVYTKTPWDPIPVPSNLPYAIRWASFVGWKSGSRSPLRTFNAVTVAHVLRELTSTEAVDVIHAQGEEIALASFHRSLIGAARLIVTPRFPSYPSALMSSSSLRRAFVLPKYKALEIAVRHADVCCPTSQAAAELVQKAFRISSSQIHVIPNGVGPAYLEVSRTPQANHGPLLFFGRLEKSKGVDVLLRALALIPEIHAPLIIIGRGTEESALKALAQELRLKHRVQFRGWHSPDVIARELAQSRMAILPSREESFGNAVVEAMASGTPTIATHVGSLPEVVAGDAGAHALLVPPDDPARLAAAIVELLSNAVRAQALGAAGKDHVRAHYSWDRTARAFEKVYIA